MRRHLVRGVILCGVLIAVVLAPLGVTAEGPQIIRFEWQDNPEFSIDCRSLGYGDFVITSESDGFGHVKEWFDESSVIERAQVFLWINNVIMVTRGDGSVQTWEDPGRHTDFYTFVTGSPLTHTRAGLTYNVHSPDGGVILHDTGSFVFNFETGQLEHTGGPKDYWGIADDLDKVFEVFCTTFH